jgi:hypothetical protein
VSADPRDWRCADYARSQHLDPVGTAGEHDAFLLVETPLPWPSDVMDAPLLAPLAPLVREALAGGLDVRVMAVAPRDEVGGRLRVVHRRRAATPSAELSGTDHMVDATGLVDVVEALLAGHGHPTAVGPSPRELLVCTHGRRDVCCGHAGTLLHAEVEHRWSDVRVWRCSHTGGHRFAPTAITFPDGRYWAHLDADLLGRVVERESGVEVLRSHYRGRAGLDPWQQAVERELFLEHGWSWVEVVVDAETITETADGADVRLRWDDQAVDATVAVRRRVPTLQCGSPPDEHTKTGAELEVVRLTHR